MRIVAVAPGGDAAPRLEALLERITAHPDLVAAARLGGSAWALAAFVATRRMEENAAEARLRPAFAISVGDAVRRGLPTAARATLSGRAPLREGLVEGSFGGALARSLAATTDVLLALGEAEAEGAERWVLVISSLGEPSLVAAPFDAGASAPTRAAALLGDGASALLVGPAAEAGIPFAHLASWTDLAAAPSLVGRGGLGFTVAQTGLVGVTVERPIRVAQTDEADELRSALEASPRLLARASGGTLELVDARGGSAGAAQVKAELHDGSSAKKHGCVGCPTPCGWQFRTDQNRESRVGGRFAALQGFLSGGKGDAALLAVEACNQFGLDARSTARFFQLALPPESFAGGSAAAAVEELMRKDSELHRRALAFSLSDDHEPASPTLPGDLAARIGKALSARGPEPLRSISVLGLEASSTTDAGVRSRLASELALDGLTDSVEWNAGRIAHWHECLAAAIDQFGFCAFSASGLIADRVLDLDGLASHLVAGRGSSPGDESGGRRLLRLGAELVALHREFSGQSVERAAAPDLPDAAVRGYLNAVSGRWDGRATEPPDASDVSTSGASSVAAEPGAELGITVRVTGLLASRFGDFPGARSAQGGSELSLPLRLPASEATVAGAIEALARAVPSARSWLLTPAGRPLPAALISGHSVSSTAKLRPGAMIDLLMVIPGG